MKNFRSIRDILDFAISREIEANKFYEQLSRKVDKPEIQNKLSYFAIDEFQHKVKLEAVIDGDEEFCHEEVGSLNIAD